jgi:hypothetical protein
MHIANGRSEDTPQCYVSKLSLCNSSNFFLASRIFIFNAAVSAPQQSVFLAMLHETCILTNSWVVCHDEYIRIPRQLIQHRREVRKLHLKRVELLTDARARVLECLDELGRALVPCRIKPVRIRILLVLSDDRRARAVRAEARLGPGRCRGRGQRGGHRRRWRLGQRVRGRRDDEERRTLKEDNLGRVAGVSKLGEVSREDRGVWDERVDDARPGLCTTIRKSTPITARR